MWSVVMNSQQIRYARYGYVFCRYEFVAISLPANRAMCFNYSLCSSNELIITVLYMKHALFVPSYRYVIKRYEFITNSLYQLWLRGISL